MTIELTDPACYTTVFQNGIANLELAFDTAALTCGIEQISFFLSFFLSFFSFSKMLLKNGFLYDMH